MSAIEDVKLVLKQPIEISGQTDSMNISGCDLLSIGHVLLADCIGEKQLMQHNSDGKHVKDIQLSNEQYDLTTIDSQHIAVTYGVEGYIEIINIITDEVETIIKTGDRCLGISYFDGKLYTVVGWQAILVTDLCGKTLTTIELYTDHAGCIATNKDGIVYSDFVNNTVTYCTFEGKRIWEFRSESVSFPRGLAFDNNQNVFVAGSDSNNVTIISRDGKTSRTVLTESNGLEYPRAVSFDKRHGLLLVCNVGNKKAAIFEVI
jgi:DNA-binding beta-propeller fold protein YncE